MNAGVNKMPFHHQSLLQDLDPLRELHTRPSEILQSPLICHHFAVVDYDLTQLNRYLEHQFSSFSDGVTFDNVLYKSLDLGGVRLRYERHSEFISLTFFCSDDDQRNICFAWLGDQLPARILTSTYIDVKQSNKSETVDNDINDGSFPIAVFTGRGRALLKANFQRDEQDGNFHFKLHDYEMSPRQLGRTIQRIYEIVDYASLSLRALEPARKISPTLSGFEQDLSHISHGLTLEHDQSDYKIANQQLMKKLNDVSAAIEQMVADHSFQFSAAKAYHALVYSRMESLREDKISTAQTVTEFMSRRYFPAMRFIESIDQRQERLAERARRIGSLMRTMIDHALQEQNTNILASMNKRVTMQLQLQRMVEGLSIIAISYYLTGLLSYFVTSIIELPWFHDQGIRADAKMITGFLVPFVLVTVAVFLKRLHHSIQQKSLRDDG